MLTNRNYELLPDFVAPRDTTELLDKRKEKFAEDKRSLPLTHSQPHLSSGSEAKVPGGLQVIGANSEERQRPGDNAGAELRVPNNPGEYKGARIEFSCSTLGRPKIECKCID